MEATVLLCEDEPLLRAVLAEALADEGYAVVPCASLEELLRGLAEHAPAVIVTDFWGGSHERVAEGERAEVRAVGASAPTILCTGRAWSHHEDAASLGVAALLPKPIDLDALLEALAAVRPPVGGPS